MHPTYSLRYRITTRCTALVLSMTCSSWGPRRFHLQLHSHECSGCRKIANSRFAYAAFEEAFQGKRWAALTAQGARPQRPLWASTGVKNPDYSDTMYVTELTVADTVNTTPEKTLLAFADHGEVEGDKVTGTAAQAQEVFDALEGLGIDLTDVFLTVEDEGVDKFEKSWTELLATVKGQLAAAR
jgi:transaldolase